MRMASQVSPYETYVPEPRQAFFHSIPATGGKLIKGAIGGYGGGKSTACEEEVVELCQRFPGGMSISTRKSVEGRAELSVLSDLKKMLLPGGHAEWRASDNHFLFPNGHQHYVIPGEQWERFGSMEITHYFIQEAQELTDGRVFQTLNARLRHPAGKWDGKPYYRGLFDARGVDRQHWIFYDFIEKAWDADTPSTFRPHAENPSFVYVKFRSRDNRWLPDGYVEELILEHRDDPSWIDVFIEGEIGIEVEGRAVYGDAFDPATHVAEISEDPSLRIMRGWDFGYRAPAVVWCQYSRSGRLLVLREFCPKNISTDALIDQALAFQANEFPSRASEFYVDYVDAAGDQINSSEYRDIQILEDRLGAEPNWRKGNIENGLNVLRNLMQKTVKVKGKTEPRFAVDASCETLIAALRGSYHYPQDNPTKPPIKGGSYVGVCDALRYVAQLVIEDGVVEDYRGYGSMSARRQETALGKW